MGVKIIDMIGIGLVVVGLAMTAFLYLGRQPSSDVQGFTIEEIPSAPHDPPAFPTPGGDAI
jgi:hypothetical protein